MSHYPPPTPTTEALVSGAHRGDNRAQRALYDRYYSFARSIALHYGESEANAEDIVQDAFIKLLRELAENTFAGNFTAYFRRIIINTAIDHFRASRRRLHLFDRLRTEVFQTASNAAERLLETEDIIRFLHRLTPAYRLVFNLYVVEGYTHEEIATKLGISSGTSKSNLHKARKKLRSLAGPYFQAENPAHHA